MAAEYCASGSTAEKYVSQETTKGYKCRGGENRERKAGAAPSGGREQRTLTMSSKSSEGEPETGGLSVPFKGPLLCESLPDVNGDTSCRIQSRICYQSGLHFMCLPCYFKL